MQVTLVATGHTASGGTPLVMHNERLVDPVDEFVMAIAAISGKRKKTHADHADMSRLEFYGGMYTTEPLTLAYIDATKRPKNGMAPCVPAVNVLRCLQQGGTKDKRGLDVLRGVHPVVDSATLTYDGPTDPVELYKDGRFLLRKSVGVQRARTMRSRPIFAEWSLRLPVEVDQHVFNIETVENIWAYAGRYVGLGEMRPIHGRFAATIEEGS